VFTQSKVDQLVKAEVAENFLPKTGKNHVIVCGDFKNYNSVFKGVQTQSHKFQMMHEVINVYNASINILNHMYQPKFRVIRNPEEITKILKDYNINLNQMPTMNYDDPVNFYYEAVPEDTELRKNLPDIYEIQRKDGIFYRKITWVTSINNS